MRMPTREEQWTRLHDKAAVVFLTTECRVLVTLTDEIFELTIVRDKRRLVVRDLDFFRAMEELEKFLQFYEMITKTDRR